MSNGDDEEHGWLDDFGSTGGYTNPHYEEIDGDNWDHKDPDGIYGGVAWNETETFNTEEGAFFRAAELINLQKNDEEHISNEVWMSRNDRNEELKAELGMIYPIYRLGNTWYLDYRVFVEGGRGDS